MTVSRQSEFVDDRDLEILATMRTSDEDIVFVSGSRIEGLGNRHSDVDFFLVVADELRFLQQPAVRERHYVDCEYHSLRALRKLAERVNGSDGHDHPSVSDADIDLYYRTAIGVAVIDPKGFDKLRVGFTKSAAARAFAKVTRARAAEQLAQARSSLACRDPLLALFAARTAQEAATNAFLAEHGEAYPNTKWRFEKAARRFGRGSTEYAAIWQLRNIGSRSIGDYLDAVERFCNDHGIHAQVRHAFRPRSVRRAQKAALVALKDGSGVILDANVAHRVTPCGRTIWEEIGKRSDEAAIAEGVAERLGLPLLDARTLTTQFIDELCRHGLIAQGDADDA